MANILHKDASIPRGLRELASRLPRVRHQAGLMRRLSDAALRDAGEGVKESFSLDKESESAVDAAMALSVEALRRSVGIELYDVQLMAALALSKGAVAEMQTGEGKTYSVAPAAVASAMRTGGVHVATPNSYLAGRDFELLRPAFELLGVSVGLLGDSSASTESKSVAYDCEITYGTGFDFGFDYLRDQALRQTAVRASLGTELLDKLSGAVKHGRSSIQRGHQVALVDEIDNVLLDDAGSPLILCDAPQGAAEDAQVCLLARSLVPKLLAGGYFQIGGGGSLHLNEEGLRLIHAPDVSIPLQQLRRPWSEYVQQAVKAELLFRREVHYVLDGKEIRIVDGGTGRIFSDRTWSEGLHQAIEAKEGLPISSERSILAQITRQRYFRNYRMLAGMTGTAVGCEAEFRTIYNMRICKIPRRLPCRRQIYPTRAFATEDAKWEAITEETLAIHREGRPILIGTRTILDSEKMADLLGRRQVAFELLNGKQDAEEATVISQAGAKGAVTIATNLAGRGTDIRVCDEVKETGGLHVIVSEPNELERVDRQLVGRCARQGERGTARTFVSAADALIQAHAPWLERPIRRCADRRGELQLNMSHRLRYVQQMVERKQAAARMELMKRDLARENLLTRMSDVS